MVFGAVLAVVFFGGLVWINHSGRQRKSPVAAFVDDLERHRWVVIVLLAVLVAFDKHFGFSGGLLQSKLVLGALIAVIFVARQLISTTSSTPGTPSTRP